MSKWFSMNQSHRGADIAIFGNIGAGDLTAKDFSAALTALGTVPLNIRINSDGGDVFTGFAIFNMLNRHPAHKVVTVEGLAASMASVIAMAGNRIVMPSNAMLMIHNPVGGIAGSSDEIVSFGEALDRMAESIAQTYASRTKLPLTEIKEMMDRETWLDAEEAVAKGFADEIETPMAFAAKADTSRFANVPANLYAAPTAAELAKARWSNTSRRAWDKFNAGGAS